MKKIINLILGRFTIVALLIFLQFSWLVAVLYSFSYQFTYVNLTIRVLAVMVVLYIVNRWINPSNKLSWTFIILLSPILGVSLYVIFGTSSISKNTRKGMDAVNQKVMKYVVQTPEVNQRLEAEDKQVYRQTKYINDWSGLPVYQNTSTKYYRCGEEMFEDMLKALEGAEHFIFLEYFIVETGYMLEQILEILVRKVNKGVDVRIMYDDVGCISTLPSKYYQVLRKKGIKCTVFNPFRPIMSVIMNNRDHRKIFVVDGKIGFTGGINIADEYINKVERFGYWKDTGVRLEGEGVWNLTVMFLSIWNYINHSTEDYKRFKPCVYQAEPFLSDGYVQPYGDSPLDDEDVGATVYMNIINHAEDYVYIFTPYLIIGHEMIVSLCNAAKAGVDVRIVTPGIPDKKMIFLLTQSYYLPLIESGVKIYQYRPGFIHAKSFVCDDKIAAVGSINMDYRSFFLHFECGVFMYRSKAVMQLKEDCMEVFACSDEITLDFCKNRNAFVQILQGVMRLFAPML